MVSELVEGTSFSTSTGSATSLYNSIIIPNSKFLISNYSKNVSFNFNEIDSRIETAHVNDC
jgi:hypothetical protein